MTMAGHGVEAEQASTPQVAINGIRGEEAFLAAIDEAIEYFNDGDIVSGTVVKVDRDEVLLDIGYKTEGVIPSREMSIKHDVDPSEVVSVGDEIEALVLQKEDEEGRLILSKKRAQYERAWGTIEEIKEEDGIVTGTVIEVVKGGLILDIGLRGFLPASLVEMRRVRDLQPYMGKQIEAKIIELDKSRNNVVLSRRALLMQLQSEVPLDLQTEGILYFLGSVVRGRVVSCGPVVSYLELDTNTQGILLRCEFPANASPEIGREAWGEVLAIIGETGALLLGTPERPISQDHDLLKDVQELRRLVEERRISDLPRESRLHLSTEEAARIFNAVLMSACMLWAPSIAMVWLTSRNGHLGGATPIDVLLTDGALEVLEALDASASGAYA